ncbi:MAG TPA: MBL fold metallo-hydrolase [Myxococcales bacterium]|jgi:L-ascorbate metabolism protein UlaG (beta-lactamase superfamily)
MATLKLIRHATLQLEYGGRRLLVDPVLSAKGALDPAAQSGNDRRNPLVDLPVPVATLLDYEECLVTHAHRDHLDPAALEQLPKDKPILCQPADLSRLQSARFQDVVPVEAKVQRGEIEVARTPGEHGKGEMIQKMGVSSGFVLRHPAEPSLYLAGDTVWCKAMQANLRTHRPEAIVLNAGAATFTQGGPVTMTVDDVIAVARDASLARIVVVHLEAWNHCGLSRAELRERLDEEGLGERVTVPDDGQDVDLS